MLTKAVIRRLTFRGKVRGFRLYLHLSNPDRVEIYDIERAVIPEDIAVFLTVSSDSDQELISRAGLLMSKEELDGSMRVENITHNREKAEKAISVLRRYTTMQLRENSTVAGIS